TRYSPNRDPSNSAATTSGGAESGDPAEYGGRGSYSIPNCTVCANRSPSIRPASPSAMSIPADTPAALTYLPSSTTRSRTGTTPCSANCPIAAQCVVARRPLNSPAAANTSDPVHTDTVHELPESTSRNHSCTGPGPISAACP